MRLLLFCTASFFFLLTNAVVAQQFSCGADSVFSRFLTQHPGLRQRHELLEQQRYQQLKKPADAQSDAASAYVLPVVVHIIHQNGPENLSDAAVQQGIQYLNDAFANRNYFDNGDGVPTPFQFCLARRAPDGSATNGINRIQSLLTNVDMDAQDLALKNLIRWDPTQYINIWLVAEIVSFTSGSGVAGYAYLPAAHGTNVDGIVMEARWFGASEAKTGVFIHEMGHYLGLYHTFQGGCKNDDCNADGDRVCDTPPDQSTAWLPCGSIQNSCTTDTQSGFVTDQNDMTINYMDYATLDCYNAFTAGQSDRMEFYLTGIRKSLLLSKACIDACTSPVTALFTTLAGPVVEAGATVVFENKSVNASGFRWLINGTEVGTGPGLSRLMDTPGTVVVGLVATGADSNCVDVYYDTLTVVCLLSASFSMSDANPALGSTITLNATDPVATQWQWTVNGAPIGSADSATVTFQAAGFYSICLTAGNDYCAETACQSVEIIDSTDCGSNFFKTLQYPYVVENMTKLPAGNWLYCGSFRGDSALLFHLSPTGTLSDALSLNIFPGKKESMLHIRTVNGGYAVGVGLGFVQSAAGSNEFFVVKYDYQTKTIVWVRTYRGIDFGISGSRVLITQLPGSGNYLIASGNSANTARSLVIEIDAETGDIAKGQFLRNTGTSIFFQAIAGSGQQLYLCGTYSVATAQTGAHLTALDGNGQILWSKYYVNTALNLFGFGVAQRDNALYLMADGVGNNMYFTIIKTDLSGQLLWARRVELPIHTAPTMGKNILAVSDGIIVHFADPQSKRSYLYKFDPQGNLIWHKRLELPLDFYIRELKADGNTLMLTGYFLDGGYDPLLIRLHPERNFDVPCLYFDHADAPVSVIDITALEATVDTPPLSWDYLGNAVNPAPLKLTLQPVCPVQECPENCYNGLDDDDDGYVDCFDTADCPCEITPPDCATTDTLNRHFSGRLAWKSAPLSVNSISTPIVANLNPASDSIPEIIVAQGDPGIPGDVSDKLLIFRGDGANANAPDVLIIPGNLLIRPVNFPVAGDVNRDGIPELIVVCADRKLRVFTAYQPGGNPAMTLWLESDLPVSDLAQRPYLADFDQNGVPEIFAGTELFQFDFTDPTAPALRKISGPNQMPYGRLNTSVTTQFTCSPVAADLLQPIDCGGDPDCEGLEIAAGSAIYSVDLNPFDGDPVQIKKQKDLNQLAPGQAFSDGYTSVADVDHDGIPELLVAGRRGNTNGIVVWNKTGLLQFLPYPAGATRGGGIVAVAEVYDDRQSGAAQDFPELLAACENRLVCYNLNRAAQTPAAPWWWTLNTADLSGSLGVSTFDFNNDGRWEVLLRDQNGLRVLYGGPAPFPPGVDAQRNWMVFPMGTGTIDEYPVMADLDHDGQAEMVATGHDAPGVPPLSASTGRLWVFESDPDKGGPWLSARALWHQYSYFVVNAGNDLSIPKQQQPAHLEWPALGSGKRPFNRFLAQQPFYDNDYQPWAPLPDFTGHIDSIRCLGDSLLLQMTICNGGSAPFSDSLSLRAYRGNPAQNGSLLLPGAWKMPLDLPPGGCQAVQISIPRISGDSVFIVLNDNGALPPAFNPAADFPVTGALECNYANNILAGWPGRLPEKPDLGPDLKVCANGVWTFNAGAGFNSYKWSNLSTDSSITVFTAGTYWVEVQDACGQSFRDTVVVSIDSATVFDLGPDTVLCGSEAISFNVHGFDHYEWIPAGDLSCSDCGSPVAQPKTSRTYTLLARTTGGCYSVDSIRITLADTIQTQEDRVICAGDSALLFGVWQKTAGAFSQTFQAISGCDSTHTVQLSLLPLWQTQEERVLCAGDSALVFGVWQKTAGAYSQTFQALDGCDSSHTVHLSLLPLWQTQEERVLCTGDSALVFGVWQKTAGAYSQTFQAPDGCDSTHTVHLSLLPLSQTQEERVLCAGDSALVFGVWQKTAGAYSQTFQALGGCDSIHTVHLSLLPLWQTQEERVLCAGDSALVFGVWQKTAGAYSQTFQAISGCDSTHTVHLALLPLWQTQEERVLCAGDSALLFGVWQKTAGAYSQTFQALNGCDSTHTVHLSLLPLWQTQEERALCAGDSALLFGVWQKTAGAYSQTFQSISGCDSTHTVQLSLLPLWQTQEDRVLCAGDSALVFGVWQKTAGAYSQTFQALNGCDSTHTVHLSLLPLWQTQEDRMLCAGDSALVFGVWQKTAGAYSQTFQSISGCDSTHTVHLSLLPLWQTQEDRVLCAGDSALLFGVWQKTAGAYGQTFQSISGCDSTHTVHLSLLPLWQTQEDRVLCAGDSMLLFGVWQKTAGAYSQTFQALDGCDSTHTVQLSLLPAPAPVVEWEGPGCPGVSDGNITVPLAPAGYTYSLDGIQYQPQQAFTGLEAGPYRLFIRDSQQCVSVFDILLPSPDSLWLRLPGDTTIVLGQWVQLSASTNAAFPAYSWSPADYLSCTTCAGPVATPAVSTTYTLTVQDAGGCTIQANTTVRVSDPSVYVPNAFYPGSPGNNSLFTVFAGPGVGQILKMEVFDRWGGLVYRRENFPPNGPEGWDGRGRGQECAPGVYAWLTEVEFTDGSRLKLSGDVTLVR